MGLGLVVAPEWRLPQLNSVTVPEGVDEAIVRSALLQDFGLEIGAGLGALAGKVWRIGLMGHAANRENVMLCLTALEQTLGSMSAPIERDRAMTAATAIYSQGAS